MVNISSDAKSVTTSSDFTRLAAQYNSITFIESPASSAANTTTYPTCGQPTAQFLASDNLPPTPNHATCNCIQQTFSCLFTPQTPNYTDILGDLLNYGCSTLGSEGGDCDEIASNGQTGVYGSLSGCDPSKSFTLSYSRLELTKTFLYLAIKLSYVMSALYEATNRNPVTVSSPPYLQFTTRLLILYLFSQLDKRTEQCNFSGNATVNSNAPPSKASAESAASSCLSATPLATFTPSSVSVPGTSTSSGSTTITSSSGGSGSGTKNSSGAAKGGWRLVGFEDRMVLGS